MAVKFTVFTHFKVNEKQDLRIEINQNNQEDRDIQISNNILRRPKQRFLINGTITTRRKNPKRNIKKGQNFPKPN